MSEISQAEMVKARKKDICRKYSVLFLCTLRLGFVRYLFYRVEYHSKGHVMKKYTLCD